MLTRANLLSTPEVRTLKISTQQWKAVTKRTADISEKLSVGAFLYWIFQNDPSGIWWGLEFMAASFIITLVEARQWTE